MSFTSEDPEFRAVCGTVLYFRVMAWNRVRVTFLYQDLKVMVSFRFKI